MITNSLNFKNQRWKSFNEVYIYVVCTWFFYSSLLACFSLPQLVSFRILDTIKTSVTVNTSFIAAHSLFLPQIVASVAGVSKADVTVSPRCRGVLYVAVSEPLYMHTYLYIYIYIFQCCNTFGEYFPPMPKVFIFAYGF